MCSGALPVSRLRKAVEAVPAHDPEPVLDPVGEIKISDGITVKDIAICAVMAGCKPQAMPILVTAFKAMANKKYNFLQSVTTSHPGGNLVLVSGPIAQEIGLYGRAGCIGLPMDTTAERIAARGDGAFFRFGRSCGRIPQRAPPLRCRA